MKTEDMIPDQFIYHGLILAYAKNNHYKEVVNVLDLLE